MNAISILGQNLVVVSTHSYISAAHGETKLLTVKEAVECLEISLSCVSRLLTFGQPETRDFHGKCMVTIPSVYNRIANKPQITGANAP